MGAVGDWRLGPDVYAGEPVGEPPVTFAGGFGPAVGGVCAKASELEPSNTATTVRALTGVICISMLTPRSPGRA